MVGELTIVLFITFSNSTQPQITEEMEAILKDHIQKSIVQVEDPAESLCIAVTRRNLWKDAKLVLSRTNNVYSKGVRVRFISESAVDEGGPKREFFRLVLADIASNNALFDGGSQRRVVRHNLIELQKNSYLIVGRIIALSLMYGGPAPQFFARVVAEYLLGITPYTVSVEDVPDYRIQQSLFQVCYIVMPHA